MSAGLLKAMHDACGCKAQSPSHWIAAAGKHEGLRAAFSARYGKRLPNPVQLGKDLGQYVDKPGEELRLVALYGSHAKANRYAVETEAETQARETREHLKTLKREVIDDDKLVRATKRLFAGMEEERQKRADERLLEQVSKPPDIKVAEPEPPPAVKPDRDGRPVRVLPESPPPPAARRGSPFKDCTLIETRVRPDGSKVEHWQRPDGSIFENWVTRNPADWKPAGVHGRQPTRAELAARHTQYEITAASPSGSVGLPLAGLSGPAGVRVPAAGGGWASRMQPGDKNWSKQL